MKYLYRIQHKDSGIGPYRHEFDDGLICRNSYRVFTVIELIRSDLDTNLDSANHPTPPKDGISDDHILDHVRYGFKSLAKMRRWFTGNSAVYDLFEKHGFILMRYQVNGERLDGIRQSCARKDHLTGGRQLDFARVYGA